MSDLILTAIEKDGSHKRPRQRHAINDTQFLQIRKPGLRFADLTSTAATLSSKFAIEIGERDE